MNSLNRIRRSKALKNLIQKTADITNSTPHIALVCCITCAKIAIVFVSLFTTRDIKITVCNLKLYLIIYVILNLIALMVLINKLKLSRMENSFDTFRLRTTNSIYELTIHIMLLIFMFTMVKVSFSEHLIRKECRVLFRCYNLFIIYDFIICTLQNLISLLYIVVSTLMLRKEDHFKYNYSSHNSNKLNECIICMERYVEDEYIMKLSCNHNFHYECLSRWLDINNVCPFCKKDMDQPVALYEDQSLLL